MADPFIAIVMLAGSRLKNPARVLENMNPQMFMNNFRLMRRIDQFNEDYRRIHHTSTDDILFDVRYRQRCGCGRKFNPTYE